MKIGFVVNPIAGMGGAVGLKGTDGKETLKKALARGAQKLSPVKALAVLRSLNGSTDIEFLTAAGEMGAQELEQADIGFSVTYTPEDPRATTGKDTIGAVRSFLRTGAELIVFAGGDGTARDVLKAVDKKAPMLGIPTGVKMESAVFANSADDVAQLVETFRESRAVKEAEVLDVDEEGFRAGVVRARIYGYALVPDDPAHLQSSKEAYHSGTADDEALEIGQYIADTMQDGVAYILGPGSTVSKVAETLGIQKTLLGVDVLFNKTLAVPDGSEKDLLAFLDKHPRAEIVVSPIGAQGFFFGRGNQQISADVVRKVGVRNVVIVATPSKMAGTPALRVDTGDPALDKMFRGRVKVVTGYRRRRLAPVL